MKCLDAGLSLNPPAVTALARTCLPNSTTATKLLPLVPYIRWVPGYVRAANEASEPQRAAVNITGVLGAALPDYFKFLFTPDVVKTLNGIAQWGVMLFVMLAGVELDLKKVWQFRRESATTAGLSLGVPLLFGCAAALLLMQYQGWIGAKAANWQFMLGTGMACAVTALPVLVLLLEKLDILRQPMGQRIMRYASLDDVAIWACWR